MQKDALTLLDCLLTKSPKSIENCYEEILPNIVDQVAEKKNTSNGSATTKLTGHDEKVTSLQWRMEVFDRLQAILKLITNSDGDENDENVVIKTVQSPYLNFYPSLSWNRKVGLTLKDLQVNLTSEKEKGFSFFQFGIKILPLLTETWYEVNSGSKSKRKRDKKLKEFVLSKENGEVLLKIVNILGLVAAKMDQEDIEVISKS